MVSTTRLKRRLGPEEEGAALYREVGTDGEVTMHRESDKSRYKCVAKMNRASGCKER